MEHSFGSNECDNMVSDDTTRTDRSLVSISCVLLHIGFVGRMVFVGVNL